MNTVSEIVAAALGLALLAVIVSASGFFWGIGEELAGLLV